MRWTLLFCVVFAATAATQGAPQSQQSLSCQRFAQHFYDWYVPFTQKDLTTTASDVALQHEPSAFSPSLLRALRIDSRAQAQATEIVGLDFDPFLGSQDPADHYEVRHATLKGGTCSVEIWRDSSTDTAAKMDKPEANAELEQQNDHWQFVNFRYAFGGPDLVHLLANLREERRKFGSAAPR
jgi:hypothetical protein